MQNIENINTSNKQYHFSIKNNNVIKTKQGEHLFTIKEGTTQTIQNWKIIVKKLIILILKILIKH